MTRAWLDGTAQSAIEARLAALERATGVEVVAALVERADSYPEIPWRAFALGTAVASCAVAGATLLEPGWNGPLAVVEAIVLALAAGCAAALAATWVPPFARLFLPSWRAEAEALDYARGHFLDSDLDRTRGRDAVLLLVTRFERRVVVWADRGVRERLGASDLAPVVNAMTPRLRRGEPAQALLEGLDRLEALLVEAGFSPRPGDANELPDAVVHARGAA